LNGIGRMKRFFGLVVLLAAASIGFGNRSDAAPRQASEGHAAVYSYWSGGCSVSEIADVSCRALREVRSATGKRLGLIVFGEEESSRFLFIDVELAKPASDQHFVVDIDGRRLAGADVTCRSDETFCSVTIAVNGRLLKRLAAGRILSIADPVSRNIVLRFPLDGFAYMHAYGL
jgi:invasion protein IalB